MKKLEFTESLEIKKKVPNRILYLSKRKRYDLDKAIQNGTIVPLGDSKEYDKHVYTPEGEPWDVWKTKNGKYIYLRYDDKQVGLVRETRELVLDESVEWNEDDRSEYEEENSSDELLDTEEVPASELATLKLARKLKKTTARFDKRYNKSKQQLAGQAKQLSQMEGTLAAILTSLTKICAKSKQERRHSRKYSDSFSADFGKDLTLTSTRHSSQFRGKNVIEEESETEPHDNLNDEEKDKDKSPTRSVAPIKSAPDKKEGFPRRSLKQRENSARDRHRGDPSDLSSSSNSGDDSSEDKRRDRRDRRKKKVSIRNDNSYSKFRRYSTFDTTMSMNAKSIQKLYERTVKADTYDGPSNPRYAPLEYIRVFQQQIDAKAPSDEFSGKIFYDAMSLPRFAYHTEKCGIFGFLQKKNKKKFSD